MKQQQAVALSAIIAVAVGLTGSSVYNVDASTQLVLDEQEELATTSSIYGHLEVVLRDSDGNVKAYRQTDNVVTAEGKDCALEMLFAGADTAGGDACPLVAWNLPFDSIELINTGTPVIGDTVGGGANTAGVEITGVNGLNAADGLVDSVTWTSTGVVDIVNVFTKDDAGSQDVTGAYLLNDISSPTALFAGNTFTLVAMTQADTLTVTWTITLA